MLNKFYGGVLPQKIKRYGYHPLDNTEMLEILDNEKLLAGSAINEYDFLANFMKNLEPKPDDVIEIGTSLGMSSALFASYCNTVFTFDIRYINSAHIWRIFEVEDRINCFAGNQKSIDTLIGSLKENAEFNFNFAFIDGMHKVENVRHDFELVKFCKRVLFHDLNVDGIDKFVDEIGGHMINADSEEPAKFGYWEDK